MNTVNEKNKDLGLLKNVRKQWKDVRHEHSISVPDSTSLNHCLQTSYIGPTLQPLRYGPPICRNLPQPGNLKRHFVNSMSRIGCGYRRGHGML